MEEVRPHKTGTGNVTVVVVEAPADSLVADGRGSRRMLQVVCGCRRGGLYATHGLTLGSAMRFETEAGNEDVGIKSEMWMWMS